MSYDNLIRLQMVAQLIFVICLFGGVLFALLGLVRTRMVGLTSRWRVVLVTLGIWLFGAVTWGGAIGYTHSQPNGPHAFGSYMDIAIAGQCVQNATASGCERLRAKCAAQDPTHPSCRILAGEDVQKFMSRTTRQ